MMDMNENLRNSGEKLGIFKFLIFFKNVTTILIIHPKNLYLIFYNIIDQEI